MSVLKAAEFSESPVKTEVFSLGDIEAEARTIIAAAQKERERILAEAQREIDVAGQKAQQDGYHTGHEKGLAEGRQAGHQEALKKAQEDFAQQSNDTLGSLRSNLEQFEQAKERLLWQAEQGTVALAISIAEKVIKQRSLTCREIAMENLKTALDFVSKGTDVIVKVNEKDAEHLERMAGNNEAVLGQYRHIKFEVDDEIEPGGCVLCTEHGQIDGQLDTQIERIANELLMTDRKMSK